MPKRCSLPELVAFGTRSVSLRLTIAYSVLVQEASYTLLQTRPPEPVFGFGIHLLDFLYLTITIQFLNRTDQVIKVRKHQSVMRTRRQERSRAIDNTR